EARPVGPDHRHLGAMTDTQRLESEREGTNLLELLSPGPGLPDAEILQPHRRAVAETLGVVQQVFRKRVECCRVLRQDLAPPAGRRRPMCSSSASVSIPADLLFQQGFHEISRSATRGLTDTAPISF